MKLRSLLLCAALSLASPALAQITNPQPWNLLNNASASGPVVSPVGGSYQLSLSGTFGGTSISFVEVSPSGQSFTLAGPYTSALATPLCVTIPAGYTIQARVTGGAPSALQSILGGIGTGACTPSSGGSAATVNQGAPNAGGNQGWFVQLAAPTASASTSTEACHTFGAGELRALTVTTGTISGWVMSFDAASAPVDGAVTPAWWYPLPSNGTYGALAASWAPGTSKAYSTAVTVCFSTTGPFNKTASSTAQFVAGVK